MAAMSEKPLETVGDVIDALGGNQAVQAITGVKSVQAVSNWRSRQKFPPRHYTVMSAALEERNLSAQQGLWGMTSPTVQAA